MNMKSTTTPANWTSDDDLAAASEGWGLMELDVSGTRMQIQKCDESGIFADDLEAIAFVQARAAAGSELASKALRLDEGICAKDQREIDTRIAVSGESRYTKG